MSSWCTHAVYNATGVKEYQTLVEKASWDDEAGVGHKEIRTRSKQSMKFKHSRGVSISSM